MALTDSGKAFSWGHGSDGQLGHGDTTSQLLPKEVFVHSSISFSTIAAGAFHTIAVTKDGKLYSFGRNDHGQLGHGNPVGPSDACVTLPREVRDPALAPLRFTAVSAGHAHTIALDSNSQVYTTGWGLYGQLGFGTKEDSNTFSLVRAVSTSGVKAIAAGHAHTLVLTAESQILSFGAGAVGQCGYGIAEVAVLIPTSVRQPHSVAYWSQVAAGMDHSVAVAVLHPRGLTSPRAPDSPVSPRTRMQEVRGIVGRSTSSSTAVLSSGSPSSKSSAPERPRSSSFSLTSSSPSQERLRDVVAAANAKIESQRDNYKRELSEAVFSADIIAMALKTKDANQSGSSGSPTSPRGENGPKSPLSPRSGASTEKSPTPPGSPKSQAMIQLHKLSKEPKSRPRVHSDATESSTEDPPHDSVTLDSVNRKVERLQRDVDALAGTMKEILQLLRQQHQK